MDYEKIYNSLMQSRKSRGLDKSELEFVTESHHIVPTCLGGLDLDENKVLLTCREHYLAHLLLTKFTTGAEYHKCLYALSAFTMDKFGTRLLNSRQIGKAKEAAYLANKSLWVQGLHPMQSEESISKMKAATVTRLKALAKEGKLYSQTLDGKVHIAATMRLTQSRVHTCPNCGLTGKGQNMYRYHYGNCKSLLPRKEQTEEEELTAAFGRLCPYCGRRIKGGNFTKWHGDNCKLKGDKHE